MHDSQPQISRVDELKASPGQGQNSPTQPSQQDRAALKRAEQRRAEQERRRREAVSEETRGKGICLVQFKLYFQILLNFSFPFVQPLANLLCDLHSLPAKST